jgi:hypothetical protein
MSVWWQKTSHNGTLPSLEAARLSSELNATLNTDAVTLRSRQSWTPLY